MKTIGLIGGMSWESSVEYYRIINQTTKEQLGGLHSAPIVMYSVEFDEIVKLQHEGKWDELTAIMMDAAQRLERAGAELIVICTNTMHKMAAEVENATALPLLHIADATAVQIKAKQLKTVALLGTKFTMEQDFYKGRLAEKHGLNVIIPTTEDREIVHSIIYNELCQGTILESSKNEYLRIIQDLVNRGAEGIILGCTEIPLLVKQTDVAVPIFDTTTIHAQEAVRMALSI
ncbi:aspartate/glutamate racemase family protein [Williamwhitmania taraxaci]|uniref:Aspartate racemase n=1 Tax=Williamwhitmania taraxaci TaxID=1640674 RepID=A0A1G6GUJ3_9BACT|nr:aspartate/glutamate racemase family protein [Williamwhitmania taraxaci]SDB85710.1 aspartate racemase [Williamwhitmania taraxaci]